MEGLARSLRLFVGLTMVAAGTTLAAPTALLMAEWVRSDGAHLETPVSPPFADQSPPQVSGTAVAGPGLGGPSPAQAAWRPALQSDPSGLTPPLRADYQPPAPPAPLPPPAGGLAAAGPDLSVAYRSALETPPPPLIDGQRPPPVAVGWTVRGGRDAAIGRVPSHPAAATYRVRDGDDLNGIASRVYGTPAAARLIWEANRGRLADPAVLPIGLELVLPNPGTAGDGQLEPALGHPGVPLPPAAAGRTPWLAAPS
jgi:nucleoid-associated protein YgaU